MNFANSKFYKWIMPYLYGWGASLVIAGALFKILSWPYANEMLIAGMGTEALIFFMSAFENAAKLYGCHANPSVGSRTVIDCMLSIVYLCTAHL